MLHAIGLHEAHKSTTCHDRICGASQGTSAFETVCRVSSRVRRLLGDDYGRGADLAVDDDVLAVELGVPGVNATPADGDGSDTGDGSDSNGHRGDSGGRHLGRDWEVGGDEGDGHVSMKRFGPWLGE